MENASSFFQQAMLSSLLMSAPPLAIATVLGLLVSLVMTVFQLQEQTLSFMVKLVAVSATLVLIGPWIGQEILQLLLRAIDLIPGAAG